MAVHDPLRAESQLTNPLGLMKVEKAFQQEHRTTAERYRGQPVELVRRRERELTSLWQGIDDTCQPMTVAIGLYYGDAVGLTAKHAEPVEVTLHGVDIDQRLQRSTRTPEAAATRRHSWCRTPARGFRTWC